MTTMRQQVLGELGDRIVGDVRAVHSPVPSRDPTATVGRHLGTG
ncbi:hypothetical protein [Couchioplanes azureus]|nr:hypothetical protein [Couchioplanes caeruleus]